MSDSTKNLAQISLSDLCHLHATIKQTKDETAIGVFVLYGSWNTGGFNPRSVTEKIKEVATQCDENAVVGYVVVDDSEESLDCCLGDNGAHYCIGPCPPSELPALVVVTQHEAMDHAVAEFVRGIPPAELMHLRPDGKIPETWLPQVRDAVTSARAQVTTIPNGIPQQDTIRIFVAGDRSSVGKSSVCLGILASLVAMGYAPASLAYIKPATQCEAPQLVQTYCDKIGIPCVPVGPVVYYKGFTRAFLFGETESSSELLTSAAAAVDELAQGKRVIMIDGVGFPSVGSICGTDGASVARACGYPTNNNGERAPVPVLVVGGSGVGAAVDAFNLNASYFKARDIPVIGAVFNKLSLEGFYSLENCRKQVTAYFDQNPTAGRPFGFVPLTPGIAGESPMDHVDEYLQLFREHVDVKGIVEAAAPHVPSMSKRGQPSVETQPAKRVKLNESNRQKRRREDIEKKAKQAGAAPSA
jgi:hypothetical protein